ncbi:pIIIa [Psittacine adenovirus 2]|uniref:PIIIa n=1 Tax=Psittacine adenovirus 2 TaxID=1301246 RepID=A0ABX8SN87_9ADEN|nr:pIIIa [Psittacine adenovirus 2]QXX30951.1 pIIIa [Psittacine adenovirus 2]QZW33246.1 ORF07 pIIIa [Psittacine siadenovirus F]WGL41015.1 pIIIa [Psittacine siadenovirus F]WGL41040.1 pIIIa [Psittacine siadenovirus F]
MASRQLVSEILGGTARLRKDFRNLPLANKMLELEKAIVEPKKEDTPRMLSTLIKNLVSEGAIYPEEASSVYSRLLTRLVKHSSIRNHSSLLGLVEDIQQGQKNAIVSQLQNVPAMSNMLVLNNFFNGLPRTVSSGQQNFDAFKQLLKQFIIDYNPYLEVYKSGPDTFLQYNYGPAIQKVNLSQAFQNLSKLWGVKITAEGDIPSLTSLLQPQTRFLMLLLSPIAMEGHFIRDSFISYLMKLYKNTVSPPLNSQPVEELGNVIASLGPSYDQLKLRQGLNYLITNQQAEYRPDVPDMTKEEEAILRYIQTLMKTKLLPHRALSEKDIDNVVQNLNPAVFSGHLPFINKLFDYFRKVLRVNPQALTRIIQSPTWQPPPAFFLKNVLLPQDLENIPPPPAPLRRPEIITPRPPVPLPRKIRPAPRTVSNTQYRVPTPFDTDTETDSDFELPEYRGSSREKVKIDIDNLSSRFSKLKGKGIASELVMSDMRRRVRNINIRPY